MGDIDILVEKKHLPAADAFLRASKWVSNGAFFDSKNLPHALNFTHSSSMHLDLHGSFIEENSSVVDSLVWKDAEKFIFEGISFHIPTSTDLLFQTCIHGVKHSPIPLIRWVADAMTLLNLAVHRIDWDRFLELARPAYVSFRLSLALQYLVEQFDAPIESAIIQKLKMGPTVRLEFLEYRFHARQNFIFAGWFRYCLQQRLLTRRRRLCHFHKYIQLRARLNHVWQIPFFAVYWVVKKVVKWSCHLKEYLESRQTLTL